MGISWRPWPSPGLPRSAVHLDYFARRQQHRRPRQRHRGSAHPGPEVPRLHRRTTRPLGRHHEPRVITLSCAGRGQLDHVHAVRRRRRRRFTCRTFWPPTTSSTPTATEPTRAGRYRSMKNATAGGFNVRVSTSPPDAGETSVLRRSITANGGTLTLMKPLKVIQATLNADIEELGINWPTDGEQRRPG